MTSFIFLIPPAMHPCIEQFTTILSAVKFSNVYLYKFVYLCNLILFQNMLFLKIIPYYKDHYVWRHCQYIELISNAPSKNSILLMKYFKIGGCAIAAN